MTERFEQVRANLAIAGALDFAERFCLRCGVAFADVVGVARWANVVRVRHHLWMLVRNSLGLGVAETARIFCVDHTSVLHAEQKHTRTLMELANAL